MDNVEIPHEEMEEPVDDSESILNSIKIQLGIPVEVADFDKSIIADINSAIFILHQIGIRTDRIYIISNSSNTYKDYLGDQYDTYMSMVKMYLYYKTYLHFDHTINGTVINTINSTIEEIEYRIIAQIEYDKQRKEAEEVNGSE